MNAEETQAKAPGSPVARTLFTVEASPACNARLPEQMAKTCDLSSSQAGYSKVSTDGASPGSVSIAPRERHNFEATPNFSLGRSPVVEGMANFDDSPIKLLNFGDLIGSAGSKTFGSPGSTQGISAGQEHSDRGMRQQGMYEYQNTPYGQEATRDMMM